MGPRALPRNELTVWLRRIVIFCAGFLVAALATGFSTTISSAGTVFTADEKGESVSAIDLASGRVGTVRLGIMPHNVQISDDGKQLVAVGMTMTNASKGHDAHGMGKLIVLDATARPPRPVGEIGLGPHPAHVVMGRTGKLAFVTDSQENHIQVVDLVAQRISGRIATGAYPHGLRFSPDFELHQGGRLRDRLRPGTVDIIPDYQPCKATSVAGRIPAISFRSPAAYSGAPIQYGAYETQRPKTPYAAATS